MDRKGQAGLGVLISIFLVVLVGLIIMSDGIAPQIAQTTTLRTVTNATVTLPAAGVALTLEGQRVSGDAIIEIYNATNISDPVPVTNYTLGRFPATLTPVASEFPGTPVNISYVTEPVGYADAASRSIINIILIFTALAIFVAALVPSLRGGILDMFGR